MECVTDAALLYVHAGNKMNNVEVIYTPWANLKKSPSMDVGQVGFHNPRMVITFFLPPFLTPLPQKSGDRPGGRTGPRVSQDSI